MLLLQVWRLNQHLMDNVCNITLQVWNHEKFLRARFPRLWLFYPWSCCKRHDLMLKTDNRLAAIFQQFVRGVGDTLDASQGHTGQTIYVLIHTQGQSLFELVSLYS